MNWILVAVVVIFFSVVIINGVMDFLSRIPHTPLGAFFVFVAAIPVWIFFKTIFLRPPDEEISRDWNRYAALLTAIIFVVIVAVVVIVVGAVVFG